LQGADIIAQGRSKPAVHAEVALHVDAEQRSLCHVELVQVWLGGLDLGFGRVFVSEKEVPIL
jgi:hypothetical protein